MSRDTPERGATTNDLVQPVTMQELVDLGLAEILPMEVAGLLRTPARSGEGGAKILVTPVATLMAQHQNVLTAILDRDPEAAGSTMRCTSLPTPQARRDDRRPIT
jgi:hypothetical protein